MKYDERLKAVILILFSIMLAAPISAAAHDAYVVGYDGTILRDSLGTWVPMSAGITNDLRAIHGISDNDIFAVGQGGTILHCDGATWSPMTSGTTEVLSDVWGCYSNYVFAAGALSGLLQYNGISWSHVDPLPDVTYYVTDCVWGSAVNDVFVVAEWSGPGMYDETAKIMHYDCIEWSEIGSVYGSIRDIWGSAGNDVYAVGYEYTGGGPDPTEYFMLHYDGSGWSYVTYDGSPHGWPILRALWGNSGDDIFAVGDEGVILHFDGADWSEMTSGTTENLTDVWGCGSGDVFAVGGNGTILHYDGIEWSSNASGTTKFLRGVWCIGGVTESGNPPVPISLHQNFPNPFNPATTIPYDLAAPGHVKIAVYDAGGRLVRNLVDRRMDAGRHEVVWHGLDNSGNTAASGVYLCRLTAAGYADTRTMVLLR